MIIVAHRLSTVIDCNIICLMDNGKIIDQGNYQQLKQNSDIFQKMLKIA